MKHLNTLAAAAAAALLLAAGVYGTASEAAATTATSTAPAVRILPLGDSLTYGIGSSTGGGYRKPLWERIAGQSRYVPDFVGTQWNGPMADAANEGHPGYRIDQITDNVECWLTAARPDVVLLHIGLNDLNQNLGYGAGERAATLVNRIFAARPDVTVIVQGLVPATPGWPADPDMGTRISQYNDQLRAMEAVQLKAGRHFRYIDAPDLTGKMSDGLHPDDAGYSLLAQNFFTRLDQAFTDRWFTGGPAPASWPAPPSTVRLVNRTPDKRLRNAEGDFAAGQWSGWSDMGASEVQGVTSAATGSVNHIFAIGGDQLVYEKDGDYATGQWSGWLPVPGSPKAEAVTASTGCGRTVHLVIAGEDGHLYSADGDFAAGRWSGWTDRGRGGWKRLASATTADNVTRVFGLDQDDRLFEMDADHRTGQWSGWNPPAGGATAKDVTAAADGTMVHLGIIDRNGHWQNAEGDFAAGLWSQWTTMGGDNLTRIASATANHVNHVFVVTDTGRLLERDGDYSKGTWSDWGVPAGGAVSESVTASFTD